MPETVSILPEPRILRVLGEIPYQPWQCVAELVDNSLDAFLHARLSGRAVENARIDVAWSDDSVAANERVFEVTDNGPGMGLDSIKKAVTAGYTGNDPLGSLGLFGMGFNIATARLGETTVLLSTQSGESKWTGVEIDFDTLVKQHTFAAPVVTQPKPSPTDSGTKVCVSRLKDGMYQNLCDKRRDLMRVLEDVYAPILKKGEVKIFVNGTLLKARQYCIWSESRSVVRSGERVPAFIHVDRELGSALFDVERNQYLPGALEANWRSRVERGEELPSYIKERRKRLRGWLGIQRYSDVNDFGIDFIRNGRTILIKNKSLFSWDIPWTGESVLEYPMELGTTVGGRIVGELHVDYLIPTYQKNDFDRTESAWRETVRAIRGEGPILPKRRRALDIRERADSPLAKLVNAYRRPFPGTKNLAIALGTAKEWAKAFYRGDEAYASDEKWWQAAIEADRGTADRDSSSADVDEGSQPSDDPDAYGPSQIVSPTEVSTPPSRPIVQPDSSRLDELILNAQQVESLSGEYRYGRTAPLKVRAYEVKGDMEIKQEGNKVACSLFQDADECDFFFNPRHPLLKEYPLAPRDLLAICLSEKLKARDNVKDLVGVFDGIYRMKFSDSRLERLTLQEKAEELVDDVREGMIEHLCPRVSEVLGVIYEASGEIEETIGNILDEPELLNAFQRRDPAAIRVLEYVPPRTLSRLVERFPGELLDEKVFRMPFLTINLADQNATERARNEAKKRLLSFLEDAISLASGNMSRSSKDELGRAAYSLSFLQRMLA